VERSVGGEGRRTARAQALVFSRDSAECGVLRMILGRSLRADWSPVRGPGLRVGRLRRRAFPVSQYRERPAGRNERLTT
jgi:hypothetical protein